MEPYLTRLNNSPGEFVLAILIIKNVNYARHGFLFTFCLLVMQSGGMRRLKKEFHDNLGTRG